MKKVDFFRKKYPKFVFKNHSWKILGKDLRISFYFEVKPDIKFTPEMVIKNVSNSQIRRVEDRVLNNLIFHLGLIELLSYWKATCSPEIEIKAGPLNKEQIRWWKDLIMKGMGQFFYENQIDWRQPNFLKIKSADKFYDRRNYQYSEKLNRNRNKVLVPVGGGKDSIVTLEILKQTKKNIRCFSLNPTGAAQKVMKIGGCKNPVIVERKIDPKLLELNRQGFLNGHTPFSAYLTFLSVLLAVIFDFKYIAFSNERSSNEGNVKYLGKIINHQYSKSFEFEEKFRSYSKKYLSKNVEYFSFLRPLYDIQIARLFSKYPKYFPVFLSCNVAYQTASGIKKPTKKWCGKCPKCLFIFACLYPFVKTERLIKIFGKNLFEDKKLLPIMQQLMGERGFKPFECVGTKKESLVAFYLSWKRFHFPIRTNKKIPKIHFLLECFEKNVLPKYPNLDKEVKNIINSWNNQHNLPKKFEKLLQAHLYP